MEPVRRQPEWADHQGQTLLLCHLRRFAQSKSGYLHQQRGVPADLPDGDFGSALFGRKQLSERPDRQFPACHQPGHRLYAPRLPAQRQQSCLDLVRFHGLSRPERLQPEHQLQQQLGDHQRNEPDPGTDLRRQLGFNAVEFDGQQPALPVGTRPRSDRRERIRAQCLDLERDELRHAQRAAPAGLPR